MERLHWLDGWRAIAVAIVIASHMAPLYGAGYEIPGELGVFIFFAISGYIVARVLIVERAQTGTIDVPHFYARRALRILPPLIIYIGFCLLTVANSPDGAFGALRALLFTCNIAVDLGRCGWTFGHLWSLAFEEQYYLLLPFALVGVRGVRGAALLGAALLLAALPFVFPVDYIGRIGFLQIYLLLALGALYALHETRVSKHLARVPAVVSVGGLALAGFWMFLPPSGMQAATGVLVAPLVVLAVFGLPQQSTVLRSVLSSRPMRIVGLYSYTLYLWQQLALAPEAWNTGVMPVLLLGAALAWSALSYHTVELFCRRLARKRPR
jgi:peptidoglycan/LPS O-acetylase OafA/YrhL